MNTENEYTEEFWKEQISLLRTQLQNLENSVAQLLDQNNLIPEKDKYLDITSACHFLGIGRNTIYALMREGKISYTILGRQRRMLISELKRYAKVNLIHSKKSLV
ncbi:helix-turn-helix domain-containing protein [Flavobacterium sp.]|jgi:excisionase family DNA binding protein|uniref:helix-turn-helix domain-containing protein n=1 Tax=Flavobacterium sp. TaxID=239 RepID=UPI0025D94D4C|nr:helix-turn-helix domain-containing protein [Flavobacterium sp.]